MPTSKALLAVYVDDEIKSKVESWQTKHGIKSTSKAVGRILAEYFGDIPSDTHSKAESADGDAIARLNERIDQLSAAFMLHQSTTLEAIARISPQSKTQSKTHTDETLTQQPLQRVIPRIDSRADSGHELSDDGTPRDTPKRLPSAILKGANQGINQTALCKELGISSSNVSRNAKLRGMTSAAYLESVTGYRLIGKLWYPGDDTDP